MLIHEERHENRQAGTGIECEGNQKADDIEYDTILEADHGWTARIERVEWN
jgi:hypothetical protein